jgi:predicted MFS family arabinose efflux permease
VYGVIHWRGLAERRYLVTVAVMAVSVLPMPFAPNLLALTAVMLLAGGAISPMLISSFSLIEARVPASHLTEGLTWAITGLSLGLTIGAATAGRAIDAFGASRAFLVPVADLAAVIAAIGARWLLRTAPPAAGTAAATPRVATLIAAVRKTRTPGRERGRADAAR